MSELEEFYDEQFSHLDAPPFSTLSDDDKLVLEASALFAFWKMNRAWEGMKLTISKALGRNEK